MRLPWVHIAIAVAGVDEEFAEFLALIGTENNFMPDHISATYDPEMTKKYNSFSHRMLEAATDLVNRFIGYFRSNKGQYWVDRYENNPRALHSDLTRASAKVRVEGGEWRRLTSTGVSIISGGFLGRNRFMTAADWQDMKTWMQTLEREPFVGNLLCIADELWARGHNRAAIMEAVCALEVAIIEFAARPASESLLKRFGWRADFKNLKKHVERFGITKTVHYLLPVLLSAEDVADEVLLGCQRAIEVRGQVVHNRRLSVSHEEVETYLCHIRRLCEALGTVGKASD